MGRHGAGVKSVKLGQAPRKAADSFQVTSNFAESRCACVATDSEKCTLVFEGFSEKRMNTIRSVGTTLPLRIPGNLTTLASPKSMFMRNNTGTFQTRLLATNESARKYLIAAYVCNA